MTLSTDAGTQGTREPKLSKRSEKAQRAVGWDGGKLLAVGRAVLPRWRVRGRGKMKSERAEGGRRRMQTVFLFRSLEPLRKHTYSTHR